MANATSFIVDKIEHPSKPGAIKFTTKHNSDEISGFIHGCPCGCGIWSGVHFRNYGSGAMWDRTGDDLHMTLTPSIGIHHTRPGMAGFHWHGWLQNGVFEEG